MGWGKHWPAPGRSRLLPTVHREEHVDHAPPMCGRMARATRPRTRGIDAGDGGARGAGAGGELGASSGRVTGRSPGCKQATWPHWPCWSPISYLRARRHPKHSGLRHSPSQPPACRPTREGGDVRRSNKAIWKNSQPAGRMRNQNWGSCQSLCVDVRYIRVDEEPRDTSKDARARVCAMIGCAKASAPVNLNDVATPTLQEVCLSSSVCRGRLWRGRSRWSYRQSRSRRAHASPGRDRGLVSSWKNALQHSSAVVFERSDEKSTVPPAYPPSITWRAPGRAPRAPAL